jgi:gamma-glutamyltranspeptidase/glutathione hydrolase
VSSRHPPKPPARGTRGAVACGHPLGSAAALEVFMAGGNAVDAAVAAGAALGVVLPEACGLGGDALALVRPGDGGPVVAYNGWGAAPRAVPERIPHDGGGTVPPPGVVRAWADMLAEAGTRELGAVLAPAIRLAEDGVPPGAPLLAARDTQRRRLERTAGSFGLLDPALRPGSRWRQPELARTLRAVAGGGPDAFYAGDLAEAIARAAQADGGSLAPEDLAGHRTLVRAPLAGRHGAIGLTVQPPPSQAILALMALGAVARHGPADAPQRAHLAVEAIEAAFAHRDDVATDRAEDRLLALELALDPERAGLRGGPRGYSHTTAVATADGEGTVVSMLVTVFDDFGSAVLVPEGGFLLTNRLTGCSDDPASPNAPRAGRRPVHTLSPALVEHRDLAFALATPGADGQVQTLLQIVQGLEDEGLDVPAALAAPRWRSQDAVLEVEDDLPAEVLRHLEARGHVLERHPAGAGRFGAAVAVGVDAADGTLFAVADTRREVHAAAC